MRRAVLASTLALTSALALPCARAAAQPITFDEFGNVGTTGPVVTTQYAPLGVTFSSSAGSAVYVTTQGLYNGSRPNFVCTGPVGSPISCNADYYLDFAAPARGISFDALGINDVGLVGRVRVLDPLAALLGVVDIVGAAQVYDPVLVDLTAFSNVGRVEIVRITDAAGIGFDDFRFTLAPTTTAPEPASASLVALGVVAVHIGRRRLNRVA